MDCKADKTIVETVIDCTARNFWGVVLSVFMFGAALILFGCSSLREKSVGMAGTVSAIKIESSGGTSTGTALPNVLLGGAAFAFADSPDSDRPVYAHAERSSIISKLFGLGMDDSATVYIGTANESADDTVKRLKALRTDTARQ